MGKSVERMWLGDGSSASVPEGLRRRAEAEARKVLIARQARRGGSPPAPPRGKPDTPRARKKALVEEARRLNQPTIDQGREFTRREAQQWKLLLAQIAVVEDEIRAAEREPTRTGREALLEAIDADPVWASRLAAHEAGHSLYFLLSGQGAGEVGIRSSKSGRLEGFAAGARGYLSPAGCLAGAAGEMLLLGDGDPCGSDLADYRKLCRALGWSPDARIASDRAQVEGKLRPELRALKRLRDESLVRGTIPGPDAERILLDSLTVPGREEVQRARMRTHWLG